MEYILGFVYHVMLDASRNCQRTVIRLNSKIRHGIQETRMSKAYDSTCARLEFENGASWRRRHPKRMGETVSMYRNEDLGR